MEVGDQHEAWGEHLVSLSRAQRRPGSPEGPCPGHFGPDLGRNHFEIDVDPHAVVRNYAPAFFNLSI